MIDLVAGSYHTCALLDTGQVRCWGSGRVVGYGNAANLVTGEDVGDDESPASVGFIDVGGPVAQIVAGEQHTCALLDSGVVRCWGEAVLGSLGYGNEEPIGDDEAPASSVGVEVGGPVRQISAGSWSSCAQLSDGQLSCWGELSGWHPGEGSALSPRVFDTSPIGAISQVGISTLHACALFEGGTVRCWGWSAEGRLGLGTLSPGLVPFESAREVDVGAPVRQLALGSSHTCAVTIAGAVRCWGLGYDGRLGYGNRDTIGDDETPAAAGDVDVGGAVRSVGTQAYLACALLESGSVRCWGLGFGKWLDPSPVSTTEPFCPQEVPVVPDSLVCRGLDRLTQCCEGYVGALGYGVLGAIGDDESPAAAGDLELAGPVEKLAVGAEHACVLLASGGVQCWGAGGSGRLGYGNTRDIGDDEVPNSAGFVDVAGVPTLASAGGTSTQLAVGLNHACALLDDGALRCWGDASAGQLGYGNKHDIGDDEDPVVAGDVPVRGLVRQVATGDNHTCAVLDSGSVRCWGDAGGGVLGYGNTGELGNDEVPGDVGFVDVGGPVEQLAVGSRSACALLRGGGVRCWGAQAWADVGFPERGNLGDDESPRLAGDIDLGGPARQIAVAGPFTCALLASGEVRCWERGEDGIYGRLVDGTTGLVASPARVGVMNFGGPVSSISASDRAVCALREGRVRCSPFVTLRPYADPAGPDQPLAPEVDLGAAAVQVSAGPDRACAVLETGGVRCWALQIPQSVQSSSPNPIPGVDTDLPSDVFPPLPPPEERGEAPGTPSNPVGTTPSDVDLGGGRARAVGVGNMHACALMEDGGVRCWGNGTRGQLGYPGVVDVPARQRTSSAGSVRLF